MLQNCCLNALFLGLYGLRIHQDPWHPLLHEDHVKHVIYTQIQVQPTWIADAAQSHSLYTRLAPDSDLQLRTRTACMWHKANAQTVQRLQYKKSKHPKDPKTLRQTNVISRPVLYCPSG